MIVFWILLSFGGAAALWFFAVRPALAKRLQGGQALELDDGRMPPCKETCDIHREAGEPVRYDCGHDDAPEFRISMWGEPRLRRTTGGPTRYCGDCLLKAALATSIRCGGCGYAIMEGDPISLCVDDGSGKPEWRTVRDGQLALCLRVSCDAMPGFCGHWAGDGIRWAFEGRTMIGHVFETGEPVAVGDVTDAGAKPKS